LRRINGTAQNFIGLDLDLDRPLANKKLGRPLRVSQVTLLDPGRGNGATDAFGDPAQGGADRLKRSLTGFHRKISQIDIHRKPWQVLDEKVNGGTALKREIFLRIDIRQDTQ